MQLQILYLSLICILDIDYMLQDIQDRLRYGLVKLEEVTKCPVCLGSVGTTVVQCLRGHGFCTRCRQQINMCPLCKDFFSIHKPTMLISILEQLPKLCENNDIGCKEISFGMNHELYCEYRSIACKIGSLGKCIWRGPMKDFKSHVERHHKIYYASYPSGSPKTFSFTNFEENWHTKHCLHVVDNNLFLLFFHKDLNSQRFFQVIKQIPLGQTNKEYYFSVTLVNSDKQHLVFKHTIKACFTFDENEQLKQIPYCMIVPLEEMTNSGPLKVTYEAFKKRPL